MAPRRSPHGFLAGPAKTAAAGALLAAAAVAAALFFAGCGGGDSSTTATTGASSGSAEAGAGSGGPSKQEASKATAERERAKAEAKAKPAQGAKQGPGVPQPSAEPEPGITPKQRAKATTADITLASSAFAGGAVLPATYTCDGKDVSPPLAWKGVPSDAAELILFALNLQPVNESLFFDWAVAGIDPGLTSIEEGGLPAGAVLGKNGFGKSGYSICPPAGSGENYVFLLYAIPKALHPKPGFDPLPVREAVVKQSGNVGLLAAAYQRQ